MSQGNKKKKKKKRNSEAAADVAPIGASGHAAMAQGVLAVLAWRTWHGRAREPRVC